MKKYGLYLLIIVLIIQLLVPLYRIWGKYDVLISGEEVRFNVTPIDPYDAFRGRYVSLQYDYSGLKGKRNGRYGILEMGDDGFAHIVSVVDEKPVSGLYLVSRKDNYFLVPFDRYYMEETLAPAAEKALAGSSEAYVTVRIKGDRAVLSGLYIDGKPAEELLAGEK